jgi:hypothetical protein
MTPKLMPDRLVIAGVGLSIVLAVVSGFVTNPSRAAALGLAIGLAGTIMSLQLSTLFKLERISRLEHALSAVDWLRPMLTELADAASYTETTERLEPFRLPARREIQRCVNTLQDIARGQLRARVGEGVLVERTNRARVSILATSIQQMDVPRWHSDLGKNTGKQISTP